MAFVDRRQFVATVAAATAGLLARPVAAETESTSMREVFLVPNFHPASCGWLTTFSRERVYCANSYLDHLDRVRDDPHYFFVMSEINNIIAIKNFQPERIPELKQRVQEKRAELVNGFFLESTINLSGGEALVRLGVEGLRWYQDVLGVKPKYAWTIDVCGTHDQMAQIASGMGLQAMVYTRGNPTGKTIHWSVSPDGSRILTFCPGHYSEANPIFKTKTALNSEELRGLEKLFTDREPVTPEGAPILILAGSGDYATAPVLKSYPSELLEQWKKAGMQHSIRFSTLSDYVEPVAARIKAGQIQIPTMKGGTAYAFDAFWIENNEVKTRYRRSEQSLQAAEMIATIASMTASYPYPVDVLCDAWILMFLNMDRNTLWGSAGGMVFVSEQSWDVQDRFNWVDTSMANAIESAGQVLLGRGQGLGIFNSLNWKRNDPVQLQFPPGTTLEGVASELLPDGSVLCQVDMPSLALRGWRLDHRAAAPAKVEDFREEIETSYYIVRVDRRTGGLTSLKLKASGREFLSAPGNVINAERPVKKEEAPADFMAPHSGRATLGSSNDYPTEITSSRGPVALTLRIKGRFYGSGVMVRTIRFYHQHPRIDFETELNDIPTYTVVTSSFPLAADITEVRRGIPYGFSHGAWSKPDPELHGWTKGIVPAVRWSDYTLAGGGGLSIFDRGLSGRELVGRTPTIFLLNAEDEYHGFPNPWLSGRGKHVCAYSILPRDEEWDHALVAQRAWEYTQPPLLVMNSQLRPGQSFVETSENIIVEAMRREGSHIEMRFVECLGLHGTASVRFALPHTKASLTNLIGEEESVLPAAVHYQIPVRAQQIVTMRFEVATTLPLSKPVLEWDRFVPEHKLAALHHYEPGLKGHPPFGDGVDF